VALIQPSMRTLRVPIHTILCIDDEELGLEVRRAVLEREGYSVLTARDGMSGLSLFNSEPVDAVVLDYAMPGLDGGQVAAMMRERKPKVPIVMLSAYVAVPENAARFVDVWTTKGDGAGQLVGRLRELLPAPSC
jgi:CheY-like chemotaxis protein